MGRSGASFWLFKMKLHFGSTSGDVKESLEFRGEILAEDTNLDGI